MNHAKRGLIPLLLAMLLTASAMTGCGGSQNNSGGSSGNTASVSDKAKTGDNNGNSTTSNASGEVNEAGEMTGNLVEENKENGDFVYDLYDNQVTLKGYKGSETTLKIPSEIEGKPVTKIYGDMEKAIVPASVTAVELPDTVVTIDYYAFYKSSIKSITLPESLRNIYTNAFMYCNDLENVKIPSNIRVISQEAFYGCPKAFGENLIIPDGFKQVTSKCYAMTSYDDDDGTLKEIVIPDSVTKISDAAFRHRTGVEKVTMSKNLTTIEEMAFLGCSSLKSVELSDTITVMGASAFCGSGVETVVLPKNACVDTLVFGDCQNLKKVTVPEGVTYSTGSYSHFSNAPLLEEAEVRSAEVPKQMFSQCKNLKNVVLGDGVKRILKNAFDRGETDVVLSLHIPASVESIDPDCLGTQFNPATVEIYGKKGSAAETFATEKGIKFVEE